MLCLSLSSGVYTLFAWGGGDDPEQRRGSGVTTPQQEGGSEVLPRKFSRNVGVNWCVLKHFFSLFLALEDLELFVKVLLKQYAMYGLLRTKINKIV